MKEKPAGRLCICLDPKDMYKAIKCEYHPIASLEDILPKLKGATKLIKLDFTLAFLACALDYECLLLNTFNTLGVDLDFLQCHLFQRCLEMCFRERLIRYMTAKAL